MGYAGMCRGLLDDRTARHLGMSAVIGKGVTKPVPLRQDGAVRVEENVGLRRKRRGAK